jgi:hypothetical protein
MARYFEQRFVPTIAAVLLGLASCGMKAIASIVVWIASSCFSAELLGYGLHRLLHSGLIGFLSREHMKHHMVLYGPLQPQRFEKYRDATSGDLSLGNIGL